MAGQALLQGEQSRMQVYNARLDRALTERMKKMDVELEQRRMAAAREAAATEGRSQREFEAGKVKYTTKAAAKEKAAERTQELAVVGKRETAATERAKIEAGAMTEAAKVGAEATKYSAGVQAQAGLGAASVAAQIELKREELQTLMQLAAMTNAAKLAAGREDRQQALLEKTMEIQENQKRQQREVEKASRKGAERIGSIIRAEAVEAGAGGDFYLYKKGFDPIAEVLGEELAGKARMVVMQNVPWRHLMTEREAQTVLAALEGAVATAQKEVTAAVEKLPADAVYGKHRAHLQARMEKALADLQKFKNYFAERSPGLRLRAEVPAMSKIVADFRKKAQVNYTAALADLTSQVKTLIPKTLGTDVNKLVQPYLPPMPGAGGQP